jgi:hypothetical protein
MMISSGYQIQFETDRADYFNIHTIDYLSF